MIGIHDQPGYIFLNTQTLQILQLFVCKLFIMIQFFINDLDGINFFRHIILFQKKMVCQHDHGKCNNRNSNKRDNQPGFD